jgi:hypothetical protein
MSPFGTREYFQAQKYYYVTALSNFLPAKKSFAFRYPDYGRI